MDKRVKFLAWSGVVGIALLAAPPLGAQGSKAVTCKDGTTSTVTGHGACSHHGGVAANVEPNRVTAKSATTLTSCKDGTTTTGNGRGACSHHGGVAALATEPAAPAKTQTTRPEAAEPATTANGNARSDAPTGATAKCRDGTFSHAQHREGACSHHHGVAQWLGQPGD